MEQLSVSYIFTPNPNNPRPFISTLSFSVEYDEEEDDMFVYLDFEPRTMLWTSCEGMLRTFTPLQRGECLSGINAVLMPPRLAGEYDYLEECA